MAKVTDPNIINLAVGEPYFLQNALRQSNILDKCTVRLSGLEYPPFGGEPKLIEAIKRLPNFGDYKHVVITNGAKQAISAALYAATEVRHAKRLVHSAPYWPSYPTLAYQCGLQFSEIGSGLDTVVAITSPNNPDGMQVSEQKCYIWDAAYASPLYGYKGDHPTAEVAIVSLAKSLGISGLRIGAALTNDDVLAKYMAYFVEISTSGVSTTAQEQCTMLIKHILSDGSDEFASVIERARSTLSNNRSLFRQVLLPICDEAKFSHGMFAWFKPNNKVEFSNILEHAGVRVVDGGACGVQGWFRMSLGLDINAFTAAIEAISTHISDQ
jgi:aspartate/methionine/tyrosine aminotransferase